MSSIGKRRKKTYHQFPKAEEILDHQTKLNRKQLSVLDNNLVRKKRKRLSASQTTKPIYVSYSTYESSKCNLQLSIYFKFSHCNSLKSTLNN